MEARLLRTHGDLRCILTALCLLALIATFSVPVLSPGLAAYTPAHGHLTLDGHAPARHVHPWDTEAGAAFEGAEGADQSSDLVFTLASDAEAASGWASTTLVPEPLVIGAAALVLVGAPWAEIAPEAPGESAPSPPPRI